MTQRLHRTGPEDARQGDSQDRGVNCRKYFIAAIICRNVLAEATRVTDALVDTVIIVRLGTVQPTAIVGFAGCGSLSELRGLIALVHA